MSLEDVLGQIRREKLTSDTQRRQRLSSGTRVPGSEGKKVLLPMQRANPTTVKVGVIEQAVKEYQQVELAKTNFGIITVPRRAQQQSPVLVEKIPKDTRFSDGLSDKAPFLKKLMDAVGDDE
jgi:hypothetical protein